MFRCPVKSCSTTYCIQCIEKVFRPLHFFHILLCSSLILKWIKTFFSSIYIKYPIMTKRKQAFQFKQIYIKKTLEISHLHKYSDCLQTVKYFIEAPLTVITISSLLGYDAASLAHLYLGNFSHSSLHSYFQVSPDWVQSSG